MSHDQPVTAAQLFGRPRQKTKVAWQPITDYLKTHGLPPNYITPFVQPTAVERAHLDRVDPTGKWRKYMVCPVNSPPPCPERKDYISFTRYLEDCRIFREENPLINNRSKRFMREYPGTDAGFCKFRLDFPGRKVAFFGSGETAAAASASIICEEMFYIDPVRDGSTFEQWVETGRLERFCEAGGIIVSDMSVANETIRGFSVLLAFNSIIANYQHVKKDNHDYDDEICFVIHEGRYHNDELITTNIEELRFRELKNEQGVPYTKQELLERAFEYNSKRNLAFVLQPTGLEVKKSDHSEQFKRKYLDNVLKDFDSYVASQDKKSIPQHFNRHEPGTMVDVIRELGTVCVFYDLPGEFFTVFGAGGYGVSWQSMARFANDMLKKSYSAHDIACFISYQRMKARKACFLVREEDRQHFLDHYDPLTDFRTEKPSPYMDFLEL